MRRHVVAIDAPEDVIDTCGTGGNGSPFFNISTTAALVVAAAGVPVAKHGNRSITSRSGSSDVLRALGVNIETTPEQEAACLREANICFAFAPRHHPAMRYVAVIRQALGFPTIFNLLGPLTNPAGARRQFVGTRSPELADKLLEVLIRLGARRAMVVSGTDRVHGALCDISVTGPTHVAEYDLPEGEDQAAPRFYAITPAELGLSHHDSVDDAVIRSAEDSGHRIRSLLSGQAAPHSAARDLLLANAAAAFWVAGKVNSLTDGVALADKTLTSGEAAATLQKLITLSNQPA